MKTYFLLLIGLLGLMSCETMDWYSRVKPNPMLNPNRYAKRPIKVLLDCNGIDSNYVVLKTITGPTGDLEIPFLKNKAREIGADAILLTSSESNIIPRIKKKTTAEQLLILSGDESIRDEYEFNRVVFSKAIALSLKDSMVLVNRVPKSEVLYDAKDNSKLCSRQLYPNYVSYSFEMNEYTRILHFYSDAFIRKDKFPYWREYYIRNGDLMKKYVPHPNDLGTDRAGTFQVRTDSLNRYDYVKVEIVEDYRKNNPTAFIRYHYYGTTNTIDYRIVESEHYETLKEVWIYEEGKLLGKDYFNGNDEKVYYSKINYHKADDF